MGRIWDDYITIVHHVLVAISQKLAISELQLVTMRHNRRQNQNCDSVMMVFGKLQKGYAVAMALQRSYIGVTRRQRCNIKFKSPTMLWEE